MKWLKTKDNQQPTLSVEQQRSEKLAQMGAQLWASRQEQGLSLEEMVVMTRIPRRLLQAIEEGNLNDLPEPIYIQGLYVYLILKSNRAMPNNLTFQMPPLTA
jgi:hypothetical protein